MRRLYLAWRALVCADPYDPVLCRWLRLDAEEKKWIRHERWWWRKHDWERLKRWLNG